MFSDLLAALQAWDRRRRWTGLAAAGLRGAALGCAVAVLAALLARWRPWLTVAEVGLAGLAFILGGSFSGVLLGWGRRRAALQQARWADNWLSLQERLSTAVEIGQGGVTVSAEFAALQLADALRTARQVDIRRALPWRWPRREGVWLLLTLLVWGVAWLAPNPQAERLAVAQAAAARIAAQTQALADLITAVQEDPALEVAQREAILAPLTAALSQLQAPAIAPLAAVASLSEAEANLRTLADKTTAPTAPAIAAGSALSGTDLGAAWQAGDLAQAAMATEAVAADLPALSPGAQQALAAGLQAAAEGISAEDAPLATQLAQAANALRRANTAEAQSALRAVADTLRQRAAQAAAGPVARAAADQLAAGRQALAESIPVGQTATQDGPANPSGQTALGNGGQSADTQGSGQQGDGGAGGESPGQAATETRSGGPSRGGGHVEQVYAPPPLDLDDNSGPALPLPAQCQTDPALCNQVAGQRDAPFRPEDSLVPYTQVFGNYRDQAAAALADEAIPLGLKAYIRDYFSALEP